MVYVLTSGLYSDYQIEYVTEYEEIAKAYSELYGFTIEEFEPVVDKSIIQKLKESTTN